ncbi:cation-translocating P-type ATPase [Segetibacter koreensis]|uniref:cation-translocating P-type ATPase n=1 Tax=Segetibacter koreensis TaxID=398037 RepID=UPI0003801AB6|nr:cation-translocating P-type ATPase [Segetibacter koreensis]
MNFHLLDINKVFELTNSSVSGLSTETAEERLLEFGANELEEKKKKPAWLLFINQFKDFMILVLIAAAIISGIAGDVTDTIIILVIVLLNAVVGFVQEYRAEKAMEALKKMAAIQAHVLRNGHPATIPSAQLVPGDIVLLEAGNAVPADLRLIETHSLRIDESALTGESVPADKAEQILEGKDLPIGDRLNMAYKSTLVTNGRARGIVVAPGMNTEIGLIARMLQQDEAVTPLQKRMGDFGKRLSYLILFICILLFAVGLLRGEEPIKMLLLSISLAVAAIPEALPALITIALAKGARRLVKKNALIRKLPAVETLGSVTFICSDKTGTLTENKMKVVQAEASGAPVFYKNISPLDCAIALNHDVKKTEINTLLGDPTETAVVDYFGLQHSFHELNELEQQFPRVAELPFDSDRKCMSTIHRFNNKFLIVSKGAVESIVTTLSDTGNVNSILDKAHVIAANGMRVLAYAYKISDRLPESFSYNSIEKDLTFAGIVGMIDPPREEVRLAIEECKAAGIHVVMITGDHPATASAVARQIGILSEHDLVITGSELQALSNEEFEEKVERIRVYARVSPEQKLNIVKALQHKNHFVSMTGDGVNDAPSLKSANIGVAMGINGTDVSKEAAHMILLDDNFATIVKAVKEGRRIYDNIRKFVKYIMTCNGAEIWTIFLAPIIGLPIPLLPIHILWINLVTDGLPGLALSSEKAEKDVMNRPPRAANESLFAGGIGLHIVWVGLLMAGVTLGVQAWALHNNDVHWQTMVFTVLSLSQLGHVLAIRSEKEFLLRQGLFSNLPLLGAVLLTFILQLTVIYLPYANQLFKTQPLSLVELFICVVASAIVFHAVEIEKWIRRKLEK